MIAVGRGRQFVFRKLIFLSDFFPLQGLNCKSGAPREPPEFRFGPRPTSLSSLQLKDSLGLLPESEFEWLLW